MELKKITVLLIFASLLISFLNADASWIGPQTVVSGSWGNDDAQFGIRHGDTSDIFPRKIIVLANGTIWIPDGYVNKRLKLYDGVGNLKKIIMYDNVSRSFPEYWFIGFFEAISSDGKVYMSRYMGQALYAEYSSTGELLRTTSEAPLELGKPTTRKISPTQYKSVVEYPDIKYSFISEQPLRKYYRDFKNYLYRIETFTDTTSSEHVLTHKVYKYSTCGNEVAVFSMPLSAYEPIPEWAMDAPTWVPVPIMEYGEPLVGPDGNIYSWARTATEYKILKWTWQDDPNPPANVPDAPTNLTVATGANGLTLRWKAPLQDPGCVSEYEIARSAVSQGAFAPVGTAPSGSFTYTDATAEAGTKYYYKVRAKGGSGYSDYTNEASGQY